MSPVKRICVLEHSIMKNFNCTCPAIQRGQGFGCLVWRFLLTHCLYERAAEVLARLRGCAGSPEPSLLAYAISTKFAWRGPYMVESYLVLEKKKTRTLFVIKQKNCGMNFVSHQNSCFAPLSDLASRCSLDQQPKSVRATLLQLYYHKCTFKHFMYCMHVWIFPGHTCQL